MNPLISIIVPVYNGAAYLSQCVESIRSQTLKDWELILVDDGSTDDTPAICDDYAAIDQRVRVVHINNSGPSAAKNIGISLATGSYITFVDGDDEYGEDTTLEENMAILMADSSIGVLQFPYVSVSLKGRERLRTAEYLGAIEHRQEILAMIGNNKIDGYLWHRIFKADILQLIRFREDMRLTEDLWLLIDVALTGVKFYISDKGSYRYYQRKGSLMTNKTQEKEHQALSTFFRLLDILCKESEIPLEIKASQFMRTLSLIVNLNALFGEDTSEYISRLQPYTPDIRLLLRPFRTDAKLKFILLKLVGYPNYVRIINLFR